MECHGDCHTHIDALNHISYGGLLYNGRPVSEVTSKGMHGFDITTYAQRDRRPRRAARHPPPAGCSASSPARR